MTEEEIAEHVRRMREDWECRAHENARHYVATGKENWSDEEFYQSGEENLRNYVLNDLGNICQGKDPKRITVLEIGCGTGRITRALARFFGQVYAVDISAEMVRQARHALAGYRNVHILQNNGVDLSVLNRCRWWQRCGLLNLRVDFAFSYIVFQHIPSREIIESYVREVGRFLRPGRLFKFQVQGAPIAQENLNTWTGAGISEQEAREMAERCGFEMRYHLGAGDESYWLWFFKKGSPPRS